MQESRLSIEDLTQLSARERSRIRRRYALHRRYETAVSLYADTDASVRDIAAECGESEHALRAYLRRYWPELAARLGLKPSAAGKRKADSVSVTGK